MGALYDEELADDDYPFGLFIRDWKSLHLRLDEMNSCGEPAVHGSDAELEEYSNLYFKLQELLDRPDLQSLQLVFRMCRWDFDPATVEEKVAEFAVIRDYSRSQIDNTAVATLSDWIAEANNKPRPSDGNLFLRPMSEDERRTRKLLYDDLDSDNESATIGQEKEGDATTDAGDDGNILSHGSCCYSVNGSPQVSVTSNEDSVLRAFLRRAAYDLKALKVATDVSNPHEILKRLQSKYNGIFRRAIRLPGGNGKGGYAVSILAAEQ